MALVRLTNQVLESPAKIPSRRRQLCQFGRSEKAGLLQQTPQSILLGKYKNHLLWLNGALHLIVICPTRSGETTRISITVLLTYAQSMVVSDLKASGASLPAANVWRWGSASMPGVYRCTYRWLH